MTRRHGQRRLYDSVHTYKAEQPKSIVPYVLNAHRRFGKSHGGVLMGIERCLRAPGERVRFGAATHQQAEDITSDALSNVIMRLPPELRPHKRERQYVFRNPRWGVEGTSEFSLHNLDSQQGAHLRGLGATMWIIDECRDLRELPYLVQNVISFHFVDAIREGRAPLLLLMSTPPQSPAHPFTSEYIPMAQREGTYFRITVEENEDWSKEDEEFLVQMCGGRDTTAWLREAMCEVHLGDMTALVVPEMQEAKCVIDNYGRPSHYYSYISTDIGWTDRTGGVLSFVDFEHQRLVIEDEFWERYKSLGDLAKIIAALRERYYPNPPHPTRLIADAEPLELDTFRRDFGMHFQAAERHDRDQAIASVRTAIQSGRIDIHERCRNLIQQMRYGVWNTKRTSFERSEVLGHLDCFMALVYLWKKAAPMLVVNPFPKGGGWSPDRHPIGPEPRTRYDKFLDVRARFPSTRKDGSRRTVGGRGIFRRRR